MPGVFVAVGLGVVVPVGVLVGVLVGGGGVAVAVGVAVGASVLVGVAVGAVATTFKGLVVQRIVPPTKKLGVYVLGPCQSQVGSAPISSRARWTEAL